MNARTLTLFFVMSSLSTVAAAQSIGMFRWQLEPHCNIVSVAVTPSGNAFRLEGSDDQCGAGSDLASTIGTAFLNPDGSVGIGLNIVSTPGGAPVHVDATINVATLNGTWRDSAGNTGNFTFRTGAGSGGTPRPVSGTIGAVSVNPSQVQLRISGSCAAGQMISAIGQDGSPTCVAESGDISSVSSGTGLQGGGSSGSVSLSLARNGSGAFDLNNLHGLVARGEFLNEGVPTTGPGTRMMWYPGKAAFRAGNIIGTQWDEANIGNQSIAFGSNTIARGSHSLAAGDSTVASGNQSVALGFFTVASGPVSFAMGSNVVASGTAAVALGFHALALGEGSFVFADRSSANTFAALGSNEFNVRAAGGVSFYTNAAANAGVRLAGDGGNQWLVISDANMKENFRDLADDDVLAKIARMPIREWNYNTQDAAIRHVGPTAQDFYSAFGLGEDPLRIGTIDADGIALRAIQALEARTRELMQENAELKARLERLEAKQP